jgi:hypothetical protein
VHLLTGFLLFLRLLFAFVLLCAGVTFLQILLESGKVRCELSLIIEAHLLIEEGLVGLHPAQQLRKARRERPPNDSTVEAHALTQRRVYETLFNWHIIEALESPETSEICLHTFSASREHAVDLLTKFKDISV